MAIFKISQLENLQIPEINYYHNISGHIEKGANRSLGLPFGCSFMPSTLKCLLIHQSHWWGSTSEKLVNGLLSLLARCSQLRYMPILIKAIGNAPVLQLIKEKNPMEFDKIIRLFC
jgi:hypothetical protein